MPRTAVAYFKASITTCSCSWLWCEHSSCLQVLQAHENRPSVKQSNRVTAVVTADPVLEPLLGRHNNDGAVCGHDSSDVAPHHEAQHTVGAFPVQHGSDTSSLQHQPAVPSDMVHQSAVSSTAAAQSAAASHDDAHALQESASSANNSASTTHLLTTGHKHVISDPSTSECDSARHQESLHQSASSNQHDPSQQTDAVQHANHARKLYGSVSAQLHDQTHQHDSPQHSDSAPTVHSAQHNDSTQQDIPPQPCDSSHLTNATQQPILQQHLQVLISLNNFTCQRPDGATVVRDLSMRVGEAEMVLITGRSGCGKTTLVNALAGLWPQWQGHCQVPSSDQVGCRLHLLLAFVPGFGATDPTLMYVVP